MFNVSALLLDDALKPATPLTSGSINEMLRHTCTLDISQGSVATHLRCGGIFSNSINYYKFSPDFDSEIIVKIGYYLVKLRRTKMVPIFGPPCTSANGMNQNPAFAFPAEAGTHLPTPEGRKTGLPWMAGWLHLHTDINVLHRELNPDTVAHLSTNRARRRLTSLIEANALT